MPARTVRPESTDPQTWRPQDFGRKRARQIPDPLIEPLWDGDRVLVHAASGDLRIVDDEGEPVEGVPEVAAAISDSVTADSIVLDGYLTDQATRSTVGAILGEVTVKSAAELTAQMVVGSREGRPRFDVPPPRPIPADAEIAFVAVDLLVLEGQPLIDVPLLERKRLLESVIVEGHLVRIGTFVRPPVDAWLGSWRSLGFRALAYKAANSRYQPGTFSDAWAIAMIPHR